MKLTIFAAGLVALGVTAAIAQSDVVAQRQGLMKEMGAQTRPIGAMMRGQEPFDLAKVQASLKVLADNPVKFVALFPENSKDAPKTEALPAVWANKAKFDSYGTKMSQDAQTAMASIKDEASFKTEMPKVLQNCGTCHNEFRKKSS
ncbi:c-type cytochrome [Microvirga lotononidis]|uniref:Cytochrome c556 n=1 Tax=Microvirga lotononidis TaxID=864069 RepID=I4YW60_9HYPH|nr:cytochrome c [Microvirga lotononidis]EIM28202.1 cytochrome c556 [Microvirga lotononidis]WQO27699.1 cytochrome c [Microvirga lotononidis]